MRKFLGVFIAALMLGACGTTPPAEPATPSGEVGPPTAAGTPFERRHRERAYVAMRQGRLADAAIAWEILSVLRPDVPDYAARLAETQRHIDVAVADRLNRAQQAQRRGELDLASQQFLAVLALQPDHAQAADALRAVERERNRRSYLGRYSRITLTRRAIADAEAPPVVVDKARAADTAELEHASLLASQGETVDAIALLEKRVARNRRDAAAIKLLCDVYWQRAHQLESSDRAAAIKVLQRSLKLNSAQPVATAQLAEWRATSPQPAVKASGAKPRPSKPPASASAPII